MSSSRSKRLTAIAQTRPTSPNRQTRPTQESRTHKPHSTAFLEASSFSSTNSKIVNPHSDEPP